MPGRKHRTAQLRGAERGLWNCRGLASGRVPASQPGALRQISHTTSPNPCCLAAQRLHEGWPHTASPG